MSQVSFAIKSKEGKYIEVSQEIGKEEVALMVGYEFFLTMTPEQAIQLGRELVSMGGGR